jgi:hypothetical protein
MEVMTEEMILEIDPNAFLLPGSLIVAAGEVYCRLGTVYTKMELYRSSIEKAAYAAWREEYSRKPGTLRFGQAFHNHFSFLRCGKTVSLAMRSIALARKSKHRFSLGPSSSSIEFA